MNYRYRKTLFPTYIYQYNLKGKNRVLKDRLVPKIQACLDNFPSMDVITTGPPGWVSDNVITSWGRNEMNQNLFVKPAEVKECYADAFSKALGLPGQESILYGEAWYNYYVDGQYQEPHDHVNPEFNTPDPHYSVIHFLQFDKERHRAVEFIDPNSKVNRRYITTDRYRPEIEEGDIIIFPSHLTHFVAPSEPTPDYPRITVAFNINIQVGENDQLY